MHLWKAVFESANLILWQIVCEWHCTFSWNAVSLSSEQQRVGDNAHFIKCSLTTSCHDQQKASDIIHLSEWQSHQILYYDQQRVSEIAHFISMQSHHMLLYGQQFVSNTVTVLKGSFVTSHLWLSKVCECIVYYLIAATLHLWMPWTASESDSTCSQSTIWVSEYQQRKVSKCVFYSLFISDHAL